ncbi:uncharacterized protein LOC124311491 [Daphnia pulicaria]|uniref:uncharacterized protein LOC124311491 n=1 Tax=Daphnia pulicaria TaxID=35523 RepID=UPI001EEC8629|nr:uncharacterized protein LOC124311491 [Daphnia pulicaria]
MNSTLVSFTLLLLVCFIQMASFRPIVEPHQKFAPSTADAGFNPNQRSEADDFIRSNGVTGEEIQEYNRLSGFNPPAGSPMGDERSLDLMDTFKFWNWNMYDNFRQWITGRRHTTTTYRPVVVINQFDRPSYTNANVIPNRH